MGLDFSFFVVRFGTSVTFVCMRGIWSTVRRVTSIARGPMRRVQVGLKKMVKGKKRGCFGDLAAYGG